MPNNEKIDRVAKAIIKKIRANPNIVPDLNLEHYDNEEIMYIAVGFSGYNLAHCSERLQDNEKIVLRAMNTTSSALMYASERIKKNPAIAIIPVQAFSDNIKFVSPSLFSDKGFMLKVVAKSGILLERASAELKDDLEIVYQAVSENRMSIIYSSLRWKNLCKGHKAQDVLQKCIENKEFADSLNMGLADAKPVRNIKI